MARKFQHRTAATVWTLIGLAVLLSLGTWQVQRLHWKTALLQNIAQQVLLSPVPLPELVVEPREWNYRRVTIAGQFLYDHEFLVKPRMLDGKSGYHMIVPFKRASGGVVLVNRGWISDEFMDKAARPREILQIGGVVQIPEKSRFTPDNNPAKNDWYWADIPAMAASAKLDSVAPVIVAVSEKEEGGYPVGGGVQISVPNDHRQYAAFWYVMAFVLCVIYFISGRRTVKDESL